MILMVCSRGWSLGSLSRVGLRCDWFLNSVASTAQIVQESDYVVSITCLK